MQELVKEVTEKKEHGPLFAIGVFLSVFGIAVISGIFFTQSLHGKIVNLICGGTLLMIGITAFLNDRKKR